MRQNWRRGAAGWVQNERLFDAIFTPVTAAILDAAAIERGQRLLDVGCGSGTLLAAGAAAGAAVVGVDISPGMVEAARRRVPEATVVLADAQTADLLVAAPGAPFDRVVSRFGVMFFADPVTAFTNIFRATKPGAQMAFACWRGRDENPMFTLGTSILQQRLPAQVEVPPPDAPGPTAFADRNRLQALLSAAGWASIGIERLDVEFDYGVNGSDGVEEHLTTILSTTAGRQAREELEPSLGAAGWAALLDDVRTELRRHVDNGQLRIPGALWLVTAANAT
jgi:SAM-dependent methyltransferase